MPFLTLDVLSDESGYMAKQAGVVTGYIPESVATCGYGPGGKPEFRGWLSFDSSAIPVGTALASARLIIESVATVGGGERPEWTTDFVAADLDLGDLDSSWDSTKGAVRVVNTGAPTDFDVDLDDVKAVLFSPDGSRIALKLVEVTPDAAVYLQATVANTKLVVSYGPTFAGVEIESSYAADAEGASGLATSSEMESAVADGVALESGFVSASAWDSSLSREAVLVSAIAMEE